MTQVKDESGNVVLPDENGWHDIKYAPMDETEVLLAVLFRGLDGIEHCEMHVAHYRAGNGWRTYDGGGTCMIDSDPTHFRPLPDPPITEG